MKTSKSRRDTAVQGTNDSSIVSKWSMSHAGYFQDDYLQHFIGKKARRCPLINRGYYVRAKAVEYVFTQFLNRFQQSEEKKTQIVSLGAGFDSSYFRLKAEGRLKNCLYIEVDFPALVKRKHALIKQTPELMALIESSGIHPHDGIDNIELQTEDYMLLGVDLTQLDILTACLTHVGFSVSDPTLFLSEVVLTYMAPDLANSVVAWASGFPNAVFASYEQLYPYDPFGQVMVQHFTKLGSPLRCIDTYPSMSHQVQRYINQGWKRCTAVDMNNFYNNYIDTEEKKRIESLEPFDEYEEWHLKCVHYTLICAYTKQSEYLIAQMWPKLHEVVGNVMQLHLPKSCENPEAGNLNQIVEVQSSNQSVKEQDPAQKVLNMDTNSFENAAIVGKGQSEFVMYLKHNELEILTSTNNKNSIIIGHNNGQFCISIEVKLMHDYHDQQQSKQKQNKTLHCTTFSDSHESSITESVKRFGHKICALDPNQLLIIGGFGEKDNKHKRLHDVTCINVETSECSVVNLARSSDEAFDQSTKSLPQKSTLQQTENHVKLLTETGNTMKKLTEVQNGTSLQDCPSVSLDLMFHSVTLLSNQRLFIFGGRRSPLKPNTEMILLTFPPASKSVCALAEGTTENRDKPQQNSQTSVFSETNSASSSQKDSGCTRLEEESGGICGAVCDVNVLPIKDVSLCRWRHSACCLWINDTECVVVYGGKTSSGEALSDCYLLDTITWTWSQVSIINNMIGPLHSHSASKWENKCVISGGLDGQQLPSNNVYILHITMESGQRAGGEIARLPLQRDIIARYSHTSAVVDDTLYMLGGVSFHSPPPALTAIHLSSGKVCEFSLEALNVDRPLMLHNHECLYTEDGELVIIGGGGNCFSFGTHLNHGPYKLKLPKLDSS